MTTNDALGMEKNIQHHKENSVPEPLKQLSAVIMHKLFLDGNKNNFSYEHGVGWQVKELPHPENQTTKAKKKYWYDLRHQKKITTSYSFIGNPHPSYYFKKHFLMQDQSLLRTAGLGPNHQGLIIAQGLGYADVLHSVANEHKQLVLPREDVMVYSYYHKYCMHPRKNKWVEAVLSSQTRHEKNSYNNNIYRYEVKGLKIHQYTYNHETNSFEKLPSQFFECSDSALRSVKFDPLDYNNDSLIVETRNFVYHLKKDKQQTVLQKIINVQELISQHISSTWKLGDNEDGMCAYDTEYCNQYPEYLLMYVRNSKKCGRADSRTMLLKRTKECTEHIHTFFGKIGFLQPADFVSDVHSFLGGVKRPRKLLHLYTITDILKRGIPNTAAANEPSCVLQ